MAIALLVKRNSQSAGKGNNLICSSKAHELPHTLVSLISTKRPAPEDGKGWGLTTVDGVKKGDVVHEYVGEIINEKTKNIREQNWNRDHPNDDSFYVMYLENGWYIDARNMGNETRFINHSCDPNCELIPVNVAGFMRISIVCIKDVPKGGFLSFDYRCDTLNGKTLSCRCGSSNCKGIMNRGKAIEKVGSQKSINGEV